MVVLVPRHQGNQGEPQTGEHAPTDLPDGEQDDHEDQCEASQHEGEVEGGLEAR